MPVLADEGGGGELRVDPLGAGRERPGRGGHVDGGGVSVERHEDVHALRPAGLHGAGHARVGERLPDQTGRPHDHVERAALRRIQVHDQVGGAVALVDGHQRRVVLDRALVGEPQQRAAVVAEGVLHLAV
nr:hypothetical protein GCM10020092_023090 [Actinoplanes digitatis]